MSRLVMALMGLWPPCPIFWKSGVPTQSVLAHLQPGFAQNW